MLDQSAARVILLVAPAGYGKTTLAQEWLADKRCTWYRGTPASADVAALAAGLARAVAEVVPGAGERMAQRLRARDRPEEDAEILAEMLAEDLARWPADSRLVIDDCQTLLEAGAADDFLRSLVEHTSLPLLLASRTRPRWTPRLRVYGDVFEVDRTLLAMDGTEATELLANRPDAIALLDQAAGWPAVLGLAALTGSEVTRGQPTTTLYDFFAEELLCALSGPARDGLFRLSLLPSITESMAKAFLGPRRGGQVLLEGVANGLLQPVDGFYDLHPLLRAFLRDRLEQTIGADVPKLITTVGDLLVTRGRWDDALALAEQFREVGFLHRFVEAGWEHLLEEGRFATLTRLVNLASELRVRSPLLDLVDAELAFRYGNYRKAEVLADEATRSLTNQHLLVRAHVRAGQSSHLEGRAEEAIVHHRRALAIAATPADEREALWGLFVCSIELGTTEAVDLLDQLQHLGTSEASDAIRLGGGRMLHAMRSGSGLDQSLDAEVHRLARVDDPLVRSSFLNVWCSLLTYSGRYEEALEVSDQQLGEIRRNRHDFVLPHALLGRAGALRGLRRFDEALTDARNACQPEYANVRLTLAAATARACIFLSSGDLERAIAVAEPAAAASAYSSALAELIAMRALAKACADLTNEVHEDIRSARSLSRAAEPRVLCDLAAAISACSSEEAESETQVQGAFASVIETGNMDALVTAYRGYPPLVEALLAAQDRREVLTEVLSRARDGRLAKRFAPMLSEREPRVDILSPREREVLALVSQGLRNRDIATRLFISEVTVKVHVRNILRKLGARSRAHAVSIAAESD
jgi:LuxR family maltose regulon positive regulatory protein